MSAADHLELAPAARAARRLGLLGGSFDPPHAGHLYLADEAARAFGLDHVLFVPAARPPHKPDRRLASGDERCALLELLLAGRADRSIWSVELGRDGPSFTVDTVRDLAGRVGEGTRLFLLLGADNLAGLVHWREVAELLERVQPIVCVRAGGRLDAPELAALAAHLRAKLEAGRLEVEPFDASSTELRAALRDGRPTGAALPSALAEYIAARGIYRG